MNDNSQRQSTNQSREKSMNETNLTDINNKSKGSSQVSRRSREESFSKQQQQQLDNMEGRQSQQSQHSQQLPSQQSDKVTDRSIQQEFIRLRNEMKQLSEENAQIKSMMEQRDEKMRRMASLALKQGVAMEKMKSFVEFTNFDDHETDIRTLRFLFERELDVNALYPEIEANVESESFISQIMEKFEKKLEGILEMKTKLMQLSTKNENNVNKIKGIETQVQLISQDISERIKRQEYVEAIENITVQQKSLNSMLKLLADKESVRGIVQKIQNIEKQANMCVLRSEFDSCLNKQIAEMRDQIELTFEQLYLKKQIFQIEISKSQLQFNDFLAIVNERHTKNIKNEEKLSEKIADIYRKFDSKVDQKAFNSFKEWCNFFVHKDDIDEMYTKILPVVSQVEIKSKQCVESVEQFKNFLKETDEAILFKATRMDLELLQKDIHNNFTSVTTHSEQVQNMKDLIQLKTQEIVLHVAQNEQSIQNNVRDIIHQDIIDHLQKEVQKYFQKLEISKLESTLDQIKDTLTKKADVSDLILLNEQKTHKQNTEKLVQFVTMLHKQFKQMNYSCLQFMRTFLASAEIESANVRNQEVSKSVGQLEQLFTQANSLSFQRYFRQYDSNISPTLKNFNSFKIQDQNNQQQIPPFMPSHNKDVLNNIMPSSNKNVQQQQYMLFHTASNYCANSNNIRSVSPFQKTIHNNNDQCLQRNQTPQPTSKRYSIGNRYHKIKINNQNNMSQHQVQSEEQGQLCKLNKSLIIESEQLPKQTATANNFYDSRQNRKVQNNNQADTLTTFNISKIRCQTDY